MNPKIIGVIIVAVVLVAAFTMVMTNGNGKVTTENTDFSLLEESKIAPGVTTSWTMTQGYTQSVQYKVKSMDGNKAVCDVIVNPGSTTEQSIPTSVFYETALITVDESDLPAGYTKTSESHRGVTMDVYSFSGEFDIYVAEYDFTNAVFYVYQGYLWDASCDSATVSGMTVNFSMTADICKA